jgi:predicted TIM-barrel fold metal-dependent hydrolase
MAARLPPGGPRIAAIVAHADLRDPDLDQVIDAHLAAGMGLVRGFRHSAARLDDPAARLLAGAAPPGLSADPAYRRGVARLGARGLTFDAFVFHPQLAEIAALARAAPGTTIVVNHLGGPIGYATPDPVLAPWARSIDALAACPNVVMKLGGLASLVTGYDAASRPRPPSSQDFIAERGAYFHQAINAFGPDRCLFESNFPVDSTSIGYGTLWNAYKRIAADHGAAAPALLAGTARRIYGFGLPA